MTDAYSTGNLPASPSPLMQPVAWEGQTYFTSQYFHRQYLANNAQANDAPAYERHAHFRQMIESIPSLDRLIANADIVVLRWIPKGQITNSNSRLANKLNELRDIFAEVGHRTILLLNATAQVEMTHHLDDELSKEIAHRHSQDGARQSPKSESRLYGHAQEAMAFYLEIGRMLEIPQHIAQIEAVKGVERDTGMNLRPLLQQAPAQEGMHDDERMLEPTELAKELRVKSGMAMNKLLASLGWQIRDGFVWKLTKTGGERVHGKPRATAHAWTSEHGTKSGYNLRWNVEIVRQALINNGLLD